MKISNKCIKNDGLKINNELIVYEIDGLRKVDVKIDGETVWLNRVQIASLFNRDIKTIGKHINNVFDENELNKNSTVANFATVQREGGRAVKRIIDYYNLDVIISVGYRVKSKEGTQFRIWASKVIRDHLLKGYSLNRRIDRVEDKVDELTKRIKSIDLEIKGDKLPKQM